MPDASVRKGGTAETLDALQHSFTGNTAMCFRWSAYQAESRALARAL